MTMKLDSEEDLNWTRDIEAGDGVEAKAWVPYSGPQGGEGWQDAATGDVVYSEDPPGEAVGEGLQDAGADDILRAVEETFDLESREELESLELTEDELRQAVQSEADPGQLAEVAQAVDGGNPSPGDGAGGSIAAADIEQGDTVVVDGVETEITTVKDMGGGFYIAGDGEGGEIQTARVGPSEEFETVSDGGDEGDDGDGDWSGPKDSADDYDVSDDGFDRELAEAVEDGGMLGTDAIYRNMGKVDDPDLVEDALLIELQGDDRKTARERLESKLRTLAGEGAVKDARAKLEGDGGDAGDDDVETDFDVGDTITVSSHPGGQTEAVEHEHTISNVITDDDEYDGVVYETEDDDWFFDYQVYEGAGIAASEGDTISIDTGDGRENIDVKHINPKGCGPGYTEVEDANGQKYCVLSDDVGDPVGGDDADDTKEPQSISELEAGDTIVVETWRNDLEAVTVDATGSNGTWWARDEDGNTYNDEDVVWGDSSGPSDYGDLEVGMEVTVINHGQQPVDITIGELMEGEPEDLLASENGVRFVASQVVYDDGGPDASGEDANAMSLLSSGDEAELADGEEVTVKLSTTDSDGDHVIYDTDSNAYRIDDLADRYTDRSDTAEGAFDRVAGWGFSYHDGQTVTENLHRLEKEENGTKRRQKVMRRLPEGEVPEDYEPPKAMDLLGGFSKMDRTTKDKLNRTLQDKLQDRIKVGGVFRETVRGLEFEDQIQRANSRKGLIKVSHDEREATIQHEMGHQVFQAHGISTAFGGSGSDKAHNFGHRPPPWPNGDDENKDKFKLSKAKHEAPEELIELGEEINSAFQTMVDEIRANSGSDGQVPRNDEYKLDSVFYDYAACNAHETLAMTHEIMQTAGQRSPGSVQTLAKHHPDLLSAYSKVFDVPEKTQQKMWDTSMLEGDQGGATTASSSSGGDTSTTGSAAYTELSREKTAAAVGQLVAEDMLAVDVADTIESADRDQFHDNIDDYLSAGMKQRLNELALEMQS